MYKLVSLFTLLILISEVRAQDEPKIDATTLVKIIETAGFSGLKKLVGDLNYIVVDSTKNNDGSYFYVAKESKLKGNLIGCYTDKNAKVKELTFTTYDRGIYNDMKTQAKRIGFRSNGHRKGNKNSPELIETEDFEKGKIFIATSIKKFDGGRTQHEFIFFKL
jgi:hypothetical protein